MAPRDVIARSDVRRWGWSGPLVLALVVCVGLLLYLRSQPLGDPDTHMHIAIGHWIFAHHAIPVTDPFSHAMQGAPWIAHEWLAQCLLAAVHGAAGWTGLVLLAVGCFALTLAYVMRFLLERVPPVYALLFTALAAAPLGTHLLARPHVLTWPILAFWLGTLLQAVEQRRAPSWWLLPLMSVWANLHGGFTLGLALVLALALEVVMNAPREQRWPLGRAWGTFFVLAVLASMLTPAGWRGIGFTLHLLNLKHLKLITEWMPPTSSTLLPLELWLAVLLTLSLQGYLRLPAWRVLLLLGLLHQALSAARYSSIFGMLVPLLIATPFGASYQARTQRQNDATKLDLWFMRLRSPAKLPALGLSVALILLTAWGTSEWGRPVPESGKTPTAAVDAALRAGARGNVFNAYDFGGYLIARAIPVFIDGRADLYGDRHFARYLQTLHANKADVIEGSLKEFAIDWTLLDPAAPMLLYLDGRTDWVKVHEDGVAVVHVRKTMMK